MRFTWNIEFLSFQWNFPWGKVYLNESFLEKVHLYEYFFLKKLTLMGGFLKKKFTLIVFFLEKVNHGENFFQKKFILMTVS